MRHLLSLALAGCLATTAFAQVPTPAQLKPQLAKAKDMRLLVPFEKDGKWGYCDTNKAIVVKPIFENAYFFQGDLAKVTADGKQFTLRKDGTMMPVEADADVVEEIAYGRAAAPKALVHSKGFDLDASGKRVSNFAHDLYKEVFFVSFSKETHGEGRAKAYRTDNGKAGVINESGKVCIPFEYDYINTIDHNSKIEYYIIEKNKKFGLLKATAKPTDKPAMPLSFENITKAEGMPFIIVKKGDRMTAWNMALRPALRDFYEEITPNHGSKTNATDDKMYLPYLRVKQGSKVFYVNASGKYFSL
jgi:hypothetical protein